MIREYQNIINRSGCIIETDDQGVVLSISGTPSSHLMVAAKNNVAPTGNSQIYDSVVGCKYARVELDPAITLAAGHCVVVAWSTTSGDTGADSNAEIYADEVVSTRTGIANLYTNVTILNSLFPYREIVYDGVNKIKRIVAVSSNSPATAYNYNLSIIS